MKMVAAYGRCLLLLVLFYCYHLKFLWVLFQTYTFFYGFFLCSFVIKVLWRLLFPSSYLLWKLLLFQINLFLGKSLLRTVRLQWSAISFCCSATGLWNVSVSWSSICSRLWDLEGNRRISDHVLRYSTVILLVQWDLFDSVFFFQLVLRIQIRLFSSPDPGSESFPTCPCRFLDLGVKKRHRIRIRNTILCSWSIIIFPLGSINYAVQTYNLWLLHERYAALSTVIKS
jgi:hypothetical protein